MAVRKLSMYVRYVKSVAFSCVRTVLEGVRDDDVGFVGLLEDGTLRRTEEHHERLRSFDGWVLDVVHDGQTAGL